MLSESSRKENNKKYRSFRRKISSYFKDQSVNVKKRSFSFSFSKNSRPAKLNEPRFMSCVTLGVSRKYPERISTQTENVNRKMSLDELNISRLMMKNIMSEKSLEAIILEAKQELSNEDPSTNEYVNMVVNLVTNREQEQSKMSNNNNKNNNNNSIHHHYEPMFARKIVI